MYLVIDIFRLVKMWLSMRTLFSRDRKKLHMMQRLGSMKILYQKTLIMMFPLLIFRGSVGFFSKIRYAGTLKFLSNNFNTYEFHKNFESSHSWDGLLMFLGFLSFKGFPMKNYCVQCVWCCWCFYCICLLLSYNLQNFKEFMLMLKIQ